MNNAAVFDPKGNQAMPAGPPMDSFLKWLWACGRKEVIRLQCYSKRANVRYESS